MGNIWGDWWFCKPYSREMNHAKITAGHLELQVFNQWESREVNFRFLGLEKLSLNL